MDTATIIVRRKRETSCEEEGNDRKKFCSGSRDDFACKGLLRDFAVVECQYCSVQISNY
jgi:hypothetical protein